MANLIIKHRSFTKQDNLSRHRGLTAHQLLPHICFASVFAAFALLLTTLLSPTITPTASAESTSSTITVSSSSVISISAPTSVNLSITPNFDASVFTTASATASVSTNNPYGYTLTMGTSGTDSSGNTTTSLIHDNGNYAISTLSSETTATAFSSTSDTTTDNQWGYTLDNSTYSPLTTSDNPTTIKTTETTANADTTTITFGTKTTSDQPSGDYSNTVVFSATTNIPDPLETITTMQEMTSTLCSANPAYEDNEKTYTLTDSRDNTSYSVRKLADGNCWMVENLALGTSDSAGLTLTSDTSDVSSDWTLPAYTTIGTTWDYNTNGAYIIQGSTTASSSWTSGMGNWYTWGAATAGTSSSATTSGAEASDSICPKGWQLPLGGSSSDWGSTTSKSFGNLLKAYGAVDSSYDSSIGSALLRSEPLSFTYAGWCEYSDCSIIRDVGSYGLYWSSTPRDSNFAYNFRFYSSNVNLQGDNGYGYGASVRCVAQ